MVQSTYHQKNFIEYTMLLVMLQVTVAVEKHCYFLWYKYSMARKRLIPKDKKVKEMLKKGGRKGAKKDFIELIKLSLIHI